MKDYLSERTQRVVLEAVACGFSSVPQGSILGSLLFTLFTNDLPDEAAYSVKIALYADDTKICPTVSSVRDLASYKTLSLICTTGRCAIILDLLSPSPRLLSTTLFMAPP